jgi:hypothetical protein
MPPKKSSPDCKTCSYKKTTYANGASGWNLDPWNEACASKIKSCKGSEKGQKCVITTCKKAASPSPKKATPKPKK